MTPEREGRISEVKSRRFTDLTVVLENVHDPHNIGAILRTCDAVGVSEIFVVHTDSRLSHSNLRLGKRASAGAHDWVKVHYFNELEECMRVVNPPMDVSWPPCHSLKALRCLPWI
ncbi:MAG: hypothetical protein IPI11_00080 [Haliscomenobacter sp.]|nr:hypothetical protein [Haliscomenobacter sp.]